jgi:hypothetical protein
LLVRLLPLRHERAEELTQAGRQLLELAAFSAIGFFFIVAACGDRDVDHGRGHFGGDGFHGVIESGEGADAVVVERHGGSLNAAVTDEEGSAECECSDDSGGRGKFLGDSFGVGY